MVTVRIALVLLGVVLFSACAAPAGEAPDEPPTATVGLASTPRTGEPTVAPTKESTKESTRGPVPASWVMPDLVGQTLQDAQNAIQSLTDNGIFFTGSKDATGQNRSQVIDSNWMVCSQSVAAGTAITAGTRIEFGAVKLDERCP